VNNSLSSKSREIILWPEYFLKNISRRLGRRLPRNLSLNDISPQDLMEACKEITPPCNVEIVEGKKYPRLWYESKGWYAIVRIEGDISKNRLLKELAKVILKLRSKERSEA